MRVVIALGGNAIAPGGAPLDANVHTARVRAATAAVADIARSHEVVVTHGNGPQVGYLAMRDSGATGAETLDLLGAESEGLIGYLIERELASIFPFSDVATLLTQVEVDADDPAFQTPTKPIGPRVAAAEAEDLGRRMGWRFAESNGGFRRVVPSPEPLRIRELRTIQLCVDAGVLVVCAGGGGIPIVSFPEGFRGVEAVIDKDRTAALLASGLHADVLLLLTDVPAVYADWPEPRTRALRTISVASLAGLELDAGSMGPKVEAAGRFAAAGGDARIGSLDEAREVLAGRAGTRVRAGDVATEYWPPAPPRTDAGTGG